MAEHSDDRPHIVPPGEGDRGHGLSAPLRAHPPLPEPEQPEQPEQPDTDPVEPEKPDKEPVEARRVPAFEPFSYNPGRVLAPDDLDTITAFSENYMQGTVITPAILRRARRDAAQVKPLMERQAEAALHSPEGEKSAEYRQVCHNLEWVNKVLATGQ